MGLTQAGLHTRARMDRLSDEPTITSGWLFAFGDRLRIRPDIGGLTWPESRVAPRESRWDGASDSGDSAGGDSLPATDNGGFE